MMAQKIDNNPQALPEIFVACKGAAKSYEKYIQDALQELGGIVVLEQVAFVVLLSDNCVHNGSTGRIHGVQPTKFFPVKKLGEFADCYTTLYEDIPGTHKEHIFFFYDENNMKDRIKDLRSNCDYTATFVPMVTENGSYVFSSPA